jgi:hypothetical protein
MCPPQFSKGTYDDSYRRPVHRRAIRQGRGQKVLCDRGHYRKCPRTTLFTLDWINDEDLRKATTAELNKGESRNSLVRAVNLHRLGRFRDRSQKNLSIRASALNLIVTAILHWNTIYTGRVVEVLRNSGQARSRAPAFQSVIAHMGACESDRRLSLGGQTCCR